VVDYHGLGRRHLMPFGILMRPQLNSGTVGRAVEMTVTGRVRAMTMGAICVPCGLLIGLHVRASAIANPDYRNFPYYSSLAAFVAPALTWWWLVERQRRYSIATGILAGAVGAVVAHLLTWHIVLLVVNFQYWILDSVGTRPMDPVSGFFGTSVLTGISLTMYGWLTLPFGIIAGGLLAWKSNVRGNP
jgi:hypothetical protein